MKLTLYSGVVAALAAATQARHHIDGQETYLAQTDLESTAMTEAWVDLDDEQQPEEWALGQVEAETETSGWWWRRR